MITNKKQNKRNKQFDKEWSEFLKLHDKAVKINKESKLISIVVSTRVKKSRKSK